MEKELLISCHLHYSPKIIMIMELWLLNHYNGISLNGGNKTLDLMQFFLTVSRNLEDCMLSQGGQLPDITVYNKFIEELKVLYAQYWQEDAGVQYGESEVESLCQCFNNLRLRWKRHPQWTDGVTCCCQKHSYCKCWMWVRIFFNYLDLHSQLCLSAYLPLSSLLFLNLVGPLLAKFNPVPNVRLWVARGHRTARDTCSKSQNREEEGGIRTWSWCGVFWTT